MSNLGPLMNAHMALYYAWRFRSIHRKQQGNHDEATAIARSNKEFQADAARLDKELVPLQKNNDAALSKLAEARRRRLNYLQNNFDPSLKELPAYDADVKAAEVLQHKTGDQMLRVQAKRDALPEMSKFSAMLDMYDAQLIADAKAIREVYTARGFFGGDPDAAKRNDLRPHYKALMDAYENEFVHNKGLKDEIIIAFFDNHVHDSLPGFAKDATLPSDPRVIYLGSDEKYQYATIDLAPKSLDTQYASVGKEADSATGTKQQVQV